jgi:hypothetical protein
MRSGTLTWINSERLAKERYRSLPTPCQGAGMARPRPGVCGGVQAIKPGTLRGGGRNACQQPPGAISQKGSPPQQFVQPGATGSVVPPQHPSVWAHSDRVSIFDPAE